MTNEIEAHLAKEMEGKVYEHIWIMFAFGTYYVTKNYYYVRGGVVYSLSEKKEIPSGDKLFDTQNQCNCLGKRNSRRTYKSISYTCTPAELNKKLGI